MDNAIENLVETALKNPKASLILLEDLIARSKVKRAEIIRMVEHALSS